MRLRLRPASAPHRGAVVKLVYPLVVRLTADHTLEVYDNGDGIEPVRLDGADRQTALVAFVTIALDDDDVCDALSDAILDMADEIIAAGEEMGR